jgi:predicted molibdopterin-dependent oxidoreductase YjgC
MATPSKPRLSTPLIHENGRHREASWDEALDRAAQAFGRTIEKQDPRAFGMFSCSKTTQRAELDYTELRPLGDRSNNIDSCNRT